MGVVDLDGKDIAVLKKKRGQYVALLIQQKNESNHYVWKYYSVNGDNLYNLRGMHYGGRLYDDLGEHEFTSVQEFLDSDFNHEGDKKDKSIAGYSYDKAYVIQTDSDHVQDDLAVEAFLKASSEDYSLAFPINHCATAVQRSLEAAGINSAIELCIPTNMFMHILPVYYHPYLPSLTYKSIKSSNPYGKEIHRNY